MHVFTFFSIIFGLFDNLLSKWNMQDIKKVGLVISLFTCVQNKVRVQNKVCIQNKVCVQNKVRIQN